MWPIFIWIINLSIRSYPPTPANWQAFLYLSALQQIWELQCSIRWEDRWCVALSRYRFGTKLTFQSTLKQATIIIPYTPVSLPTDTLFTVILPYIRATQPSATETYIHTNINAERLVCDNMIYWTTERIFFNTISESLWFDNDGNLLCL